MVDAIVVSGVGVVLMHMQGTPQTMQKAPQYHDVVEEVEDFLVERVRFALERGVAKNQIMLDPGIGFGKTVAHNLELLANLPRLQVESRPLVVGISRKSFLGKVAGLPEDRASATVALTALLRGRGAHVLRVHDVLSNANALCTAEAVLAATR